MLDAATLAAALARACPDQPAWAAADAVEVVARTGSTNSDLLERARAGTLAPRALRIALEQDAGRGRLGRHWVAPPGAALALSIGLIWPGGPATLEGFTLACGLAVADAAAAQGAAARLKWPNDIVDGARRKLGGILVEAAPRGPEATAVVVGIGLNLAPHAALAEVTPPASDLATLAGRAVDARALVVALVAALEARIGRFAREGFGPSVAEFDALHAWQGRPVRLADAAGNELARGAVAGIAASGALRVTGADGRETEWKHGEISLRDGSDT
ncbi:biotin--[acetyl-CoA-carboxylase] ligase [Derxia gummosa]|uniref:biotin--[biotin carboxyl-carrier protein] ligase n=1 Tax=Derxia gummosa DSM 723 TaxID=1121388 RepID=A0A8B6X9B6_9BURK|nr:biotin--[acetyl-CoA-carboxylase] ligase [Derxia gummosa]